MAGIPTYGRTLVSAPASEPVTRTEAKLHLRVDHDDEDDYIDGLVAAARAMVEQLTGRQLVTATWDLVYSRFPAGELFLPMAPLQSVTSIEYLDADGDEQTLDAGDYEYTTTDEPAILRPVTTAVWPETYDALAAVTIRIVAGYGAASAVPTALKRAILLLAGHWYTNREDVVVGTINSKIERGLEWILEPYTIEDQFTCYGPEN